MKYRLYGGPRDGEIANDLPDGYESAGIGHSVHSVHVVDGVISANWTGDPSAR